MAYYEICNNVNNKGWEVVQDEQGRIGPYAFKDRQWVGYDDIGMIRLKSEYIRKMGFGGGMVWAIALDDFIGQCGEKWPLLSTMNRVLKCKENILKRNHSLCGTFNFFNFS